MKKTVEMLQARIHALQQKDPVGNLRIINKLRRKIRAIESK